jgi:hypothetical protein
MPPAMGQPINVVEKPSSTPGLARFEINRSLTGMGHERYASVDDVQDDRPVDVLARRLFETGGVTQVHANGSVVTVHLTEGWTGARLLDVIRGLYIFYPPAGNGEAAPAEPAPAESTEPEAAAEPGEPVAAAEPAEPAEPEVAEPEAAAEPAEPEVAEPEAAAEPAEPGVAAEPAEPEAAEPQPAAVEPESAEATEP